jgi:signal transduction histidine kinase/ActR/RegA family two-component response regulator
VTRAVWKPLAIVTGVSGLLLILTYLLLQSATPDPVLHERALTALHQLEMNNAELDQDLLRARAGLLPHYDSLVQTVNGLYGALETLRAGGEAAYGEATADINRQLEGLTAAVTYQETLVETFKSDNALLQNSLLYFSHVSQELNSRMGNSQQARAVELGTLANTMLRFIHNPQEGAAQEVTASLDRLLRLPGAPEIRTLVAHGSLIVAMLPQVNGVLSQLLTAPLPEQVRTLQDIYLRYHGQVEARARVFRLLLYLVAIALLTYLSYLFVRLHRNAQALAKQSSVLQSRLRFERLITEISTQFINLPSDRVDSGIHHALEILGEYAAVDRAYIFLFSADRTCMGKIYEWCHTGIEAQIARFKKLPLFHWVIDQVEQQGYLHVPRINALPLEVSAEKARLEEQGIRSLLCVSMQCGGKPLGVFGFVLVRSEKSWSDDDITLLRTVGEIFANTLERKRTEVEKEKLKIQLLQSQKLEAIGTLAGGIAHDFNNILGAILGYGEMALTALPEGSRPRHYVQQVTTAGQRAKAVVDQILTFSRHGSHERRPLRMQPLIQETLELLRASLPATIEMRVNLEVGDATVQGDPTQLQQVVMNLCTNAAQAMTGNGILNIALDTTEITQTLAVSQSTLAVGRYVRLTVSDTGHGMDVATLERIFDPFFTTKAVGSGTGLGLSMVHGIVTDHGGTLNVYSQPGEGSTFEIYFPHCAECAASNSESETPIPQGHGETILLVDDEQPLVLLGEEVLAALGYEPVGFTSSRKALETFCADPQRFDIVLTDEVMPELTGTRLAAELHRLRPELPVLLMTGYSGPVLSQQARAAGIRQILKKPLQARDMAECIARQLPPHT